MRMRAFIVSLILSSPGVLSAYENWSMPNLSAPSVIKPFALEAQIQHQFWGRVDGNDMFSRLFGIGDGADICIGVRSIILPQTQLFVFYDKTQIFRNSHNEFSIGASYAYFLPKLHLRMQGEGEVFSYASYLTDPETRKTGTFIQGCFQNDPLIDRVSLLCNVGYNFDTQNPGLGIGLNVSATKTIDVFVEYFPIITQTDSLLLPNPAYNPFYFGVKLTTYGHQFFVFAGNGMEINFRNLMRGASDNYIKIGFMIKRLLDISPSQ